MTDFPTLLYTSNSEIPTLLYTWKRYPFQAEPPRIGHYREYLPPPPQAQGQIQEFLNGGRVKHRNNFQCLDDERHRAPEHFGDFTL